MIWFKCTQCEKTHGRGESMSGTMIFCECGQGLTIPWESSASEPHMPEVVDVPQYPALDPVRFDAVPVVAPASAKPSSPPPPPAQNTPPPRAARSRSRRPPPRSRPRRGKPPKRDPKFCLNHQDAAVEKPCDLCKERFCKKCLLEFEGKTVCGPCKNFRIRIVNRPPRKSPLAVISTILGLLTCPMVFCMLPMAGDAQSAYFNFLALIPQVFAFALGLLAIRAIEKDSKIGGRSLAWIGMLSGVFAAMLTLIMTSYILSGAAVSM